jgi:RNA polymerase sigma-70 factor (ECF subfamily)
VTSTADELEQVYRTAHRQLRAAARRLVSPQDADDFVHDAFVNALKARQQVRAEASPATWVYRIVINTCLTAKRREKRRRMVALDDELAAAAHLPRPAEKRAVREALACVSADDRLICILYDVLGLTHREIAAALVIPVGTSKGRLSNARRRLRALLRESRRDGLTRRGRVRIDAARHVATR